MPKIKVSIEKDESYDYFMEKDKSGNIEVDEKFYQEYGKVEEKCRKFQAILRGLIAE